jgi:hypothetical protein
MNRKIIIRYAWMRDVCKERKEESQSIERKRNKPPTNVQTKKFET